jgi:hypothetical protein
LKGGPVELDIEVRARGNFRRNPDNCDFPPLKIKFEKSEREGTIFEPYKDLKLVSHCQDELEEFEQYLLQEYLIYKAYNLFTDFSFGVHLARINYIDLYGRYDTISKFAFLIESIEHLAERNDCDILELKSVPAAELDRDYYLLMSMFNYMILNTDFSVSILHNIELLMKEDFSAPIPIPYDFDWSGIIDVPYESPYAGKKTRYSERVYKGPCLNRKELEPVISIMNSKRKELFSLYLEFPYLDEEQRSRSLQHLTMFYIIISNRNLIRQEFIKKCRD